MYQHYSLSCVMRRKRSYLHRAEEGRGQINGSGGEREDALSRGELAHPNMSPLRIVELPSRLSLTWRLFCVAFDAPATLGAPSQVYVVPSTFT